MSLNRTLTKSEEQQNANYDPEKKSFINHPSTKFSNSFNAWLVSDVKRSLIKLVRKICNFSISLHTN